MSAADPRHFLDAWSRSCGRKLDGIALPFEALAFAPSRLGRRPAVGFAFPGGRVYLPAHAHRLYGFADDRAFRRALARRAVTVKTLAGVLSLGDALSPKGRPYEVHVFPRGALWRLTWRCASAEEAETVARAITQIAPAANPVVSRGTLAGLLAGLPRDVRATPAALMRRIPGSCRGDLLFLALSGAGVLAVSAGSLAGDFPLAGPLTGIVFALITAGVARRLAAPRNGSRIRKRTGASIDRPRSSQKG